MMCASHRCGMFLTVLAGLAGTASADSVSIDGTLDAPDAGGSYTLIGQSAFFVTTAGGFSSGGQLDGVGSGAFGIGYEELFPPPSITDYQRFGYVGLMETYDGAGDLADVSLVVAMQPGFGVGMTIGDVLSGLDEATLVAGISGSFDSPEFFDLLFAAVGSPDTSGNVALPTVPLPGDTLTLVAFTGGANGDLGVAVGTLSVTITPAPGALGLIGAGGLVAARRRRV